MLAILIAAHTCHASLLPSHHSSERGSTIAPQSITVATALKVSSPAHAKARRQQTWSISSCTKAMSGNTIHYLERREHEHRCAAHDRCMTRVVWFRAAIMHTSPATSPLLHSSCGHRRRASFGLPASSRTILDRSHTGNLQNPSYCRPSTSRCLSSRASLSARAFEDRRSRYRHSTATAYLF